MTETIGSKLNALRHRARMSLAEVAKVARYSGPSSVQTYFSADYNLPLRLTTAMKIGHAMMGRGEPPIDLDEILTLSDAAPHRIQKYSHLIQTHGSGQLSMASPAPELLSAATLDGRPKNVPVFGSALATDLDFRANGLGSEPVEITNFAMGDVITYVRRPPAIDDDREIYAIFVSGSSMEPRYRPGDPVFVDPKRPPSVGDDVIVQLQAPDGSGVVSSGLIKTLVRRTSTSLELEQYSPPMRFHVPTDRIAHIHRVIPWREAFGL